MAHIQEVCNGCSCGISLSRFLENYGELHAFFNLGGKCKINFYLKWKEIIYEIIRFSNTLMPTVAVSPAAGD